jgi:prepilin-type N-terminal cleavage/methylation domain-containing protein
MRGLTLIELVIVIGLSSVLACVGAIASLHEFDRAIAWTETSRAAASERHRRAQDMHGIPVDI